MPKAVRTTQCPCLHTVHDYARKVSGEPRLLVLKLFVAFCGRLTYGGWREAVFTKGERQSRLLDSGNV